MYSCGPDIILIVMFKNIKAYYDKYKSVSLQAIQFGVVGVVTLLIDVLVTYFVHQAGVSAQVASGAGFLSGFFFNFPMNRKKVFNHSKQDRFSLKMQITLYAVLSIFNLILTSWLVGWLAENIMEIQYAKTLVTAVFAVWNFFVFKIFIFSKHHSGEKDTLNT